MKRAPHLSQSGDAHMMKSLVSLAAAHKDVTFIAGDK
jgi:hypothetical protein